MEQPSDEPIPSPSNQPEKLCEEINQARRERRDERKKKRQEEKLRKQVEALRAPQSKKVVVVTKRTFDKLQSQDDTKLDVKNKLFQASKSTFMLTDFLVDRSKRVAPKKKTVSGTVVASLRKGKVREIPKRKALSRLKKNILAIRVKRREELEEEKVSLDSNKSPPPPVVTQPQEDHAPVNQQPIRNVINFSRKFRPYCDHSNDPQLASRAEDVLRDLFRFQERAYEKNQIKARAHRRYVVGFKEVARSLDLNKIKLLFIATDMEPNEGEGGIDETVTRIKEQCRVKDIPYCFPLQRRKIGYLLYKKAPISCVGILDYSGAEKHITQLLQILSDSRTNLIPEMNKLTIN